MMHAYPLERRFRQYSVARKPLFSLLVRLLVFNLGQLLTNWNRIVWL
jgi:hypothetical protein